MVGTFFQCFAKVFIFFIIPWILSFFLMSGPGGQNLHASTKVIIIKNKFMPRGNIVYFA